MAIDIDRMEEMILQIVEGESLPEDASEEEKLWWAKLKKEVDEIHAKGMGVELPFD